VLPDGITIMLRIKTMALTWDASECAAQAIINDNFDDEAETQSDEVQNAIWLRDSVVWATLITGFPKGDWAITKDNAVEMFERLTMYEKVSGVLRKFVQFDPLEPVNEVPITWKEVQSLIGLRTNAGNKTDLEFHKTLASILRDHAQARYRNLTRKAS
jgi:hypothetical protein